MAVTPQVSSIVTVLLWGSVAGHGFHVEPGMTDCCSSYNPPVHTQSSSSVTLPLCKRIAAAFCFVAVLLALIAPAVTLAEDMRTGKLGGVCLVNTAGGDVSDVALTGSHCDSCHSLVFVLPPLTAQTLPSFPGLQVVGVFLPVKFAAVVEGLPPSRGPPVL